MSSTRREFLTQVAGATLFGFAAASCKSAASSTSGKAFYELSLAEWSFHKALFSKQMSNLDFPVVAKQKYGISVVEYVNQFFMDKAKDTAYLDELMKRCRDNGVKNHLIMCDGEGNLGDPDARKRNQAVENHYKWVDAAKRLECITIRVNAFGEGPGEEVQKAAIDSIGRLAEYAGKENMNVIIENHGGYTSNGQWLAAVVKGTARPNVGLLPDFDNFCIAREGGKQWEGKCINEYDKYKGVSEMMPFAKGVSAKTKDFDDKGNCIETDYKRMIRIVKDSGFHGYIGIEYEGEKLSEDEGIRKTKELMDRVSSQL
ncbi:MAG: sugar phosphate isomerase/epimerase family protein [Flavisolibacter sp.]